MSGLQYFVSEPGAALTQVWITPASLSQQPVNAELAVTPVISYSCVAAKSSCGVMASWGPSHMPYGSVAPEGLPAAQRNVRPSHIGSSGSRTVTVKKHAREGGSPVCPTGSVPTASTFTSVMPKGKGMPGATPCG